MPGIATVDLETLLRRFDASGDGRVSLPALFSWAGRDYLSLTGVENAVRLRSRNGGDNETTPLAAGIDGGGTCIEGANGNRAMPRDKPW